MQERDTILGFPISNWQEFEKISFYDTKSLLSAMRTGKKVIITSLEAKQGMVIMTGMVSVGGKYQHRILNFESDQVEGLNKWMAKSGIFSKRIKF